MVVPSGGGVAGELEREGDGVVVVDVEGGEVEDGGDEEDAVEGDAGVVDEVLGQAGGAGGAVALAGEEFGGVPALVLQCRRN